MSSDSRVSGSRRLLCPLLGAIGVIGGGTMGGGIAVSNALVNQPVTIVESSRELLAATETRVRASLEGGAGHRGRTDLEHLQSLLSFSLEPIVVSDSPGFASSRLGVALGLEAIRMLESGVASAADTSTTVTVEQDGPVIFERRNALDETAIDENNGHLPEQECQHVTESITRMEITT